MNKMRRGGLLRAYLAASYLIAPVAGRILRKRLARGKEHPSRWIEKQARGLAPRPDGPLIWLHAVGLGEVLSLRGLILRLADQAPDASFLVTSTTRASADVFARNLPPRTIHQFLPLDAPPFRRRFLDHFQPDLCIWAEQDIWPGFVSDLDRRGIPQAVVAARMGDKSYQSHAKAKGLYRDLYGAMALHTAQDETTAGHLHKLGANARVSGSLKPSAPALICDADTFETLQTQLKDRFTWAVAPSHPADKDIAIAAHDIVRKLHADALLIIAPRFPDRRDAFAAHIPRKSLGQFPDTDDPIWLCDTFGDLGLIYRVAAAVLIGGTNDVTEGHNPWEAAALQSAICHGPQVANFAHDYAQLHVANAATQVADAAQLAAFICSDSLRAQAQRADKCRQAANTQIAQLATDLLNIAKAAP
ncbi:3-deoxy-D-manno-octulosonic-acid transferase [Yoonia tamlensis]|uniref:3-deoxy-D-manno-octulosonic acid transferase n=1 Tax=Yoonia tamlensis TaxID=390270 RepID=A0A1I6FS69_9RHOB|nr:glycosyltransferase N-terminal domain-containing protein [Yoonia tamlensis]SFR32795.1 3-deoxy-D-manno-octulosonic-acid transferase [Yoonia tamlensis]